MVSRCTPRRARARWTPSTGARGAAPRTSCAARRKARAARAARPRCASRGSAHSRTEPSPSRWVRCLSSVAWRLVVFRGQRTAPKRPSWRTAARTAVSRSDPSPLPSSERNAALVAIPRNSWSSGSLSSTECAWSVGKPKPMRTVGIPSSFSNVFTTPIVPPERTKAGRLPNPRRYARAAASSAGWVRANSTGSALPTTRTSSLARSPTRSVTCSRKSSTSTRGSWSGTNLMVSLAVARPTTIAFTPCAVWPPAMPLTSSEGRIVVRS